MRAGLWFWRRINNARSRIRNAGCGQNRILANAATTIRHITVLSATHFWYVGTTGKLVRGRIMRYPIAGTMFAVTTLAVLMLAATAAPAWSQPPPGPEEITQIAGRPFEEWLKDIGHKDPSKREIAIRSILGFGPERAAEAATPMLAELRRHTASFPIDTSVRTNIAIAL